MRITAVGAQQRQDRAYRDAMQAAMERSARRIRRRCCALCGIPAQAITCQRPRCWMALAALPAAHMDALMDVFDDERGGGPRRLTWGQRLVLAGMTLAAGLASVALFAVLLYPALRLLAAGGTGR